MWNSGSEVISRSSAVSSHPVREPLARPRVGAVGLGDELRAAGGAGGGDQHGRIAGLAPRPRVGRRRPTGMSDARPASSRELGVASRRAAARPARPARRALLRARRVRRHEDRAEPHHGRARRTGTQGRCGRWRARGRPCRSPSRGERRGGGGDAGGGLRVGVAARPRGAASPCPAPPRRRASNSSGIVRIIERSSRQRQHGAHERALARRADDAERPVAGADAVGQAAEPGPRAGARAADAVVARPRSRARRPPAPAAPSRASRARTSRRS